MTPKELAVEKAIKTLLAQPGGKILPCGTESIEPHESEFASSVQRLLPLNAEDLGRCRPFSYDDADKLYVAAIRLAVFGARLHHPDLVNTAFAVLTFDQGQMDFRDFLRAVSILYDALQLEGGNIERVVAEVRPFATPGRLDALIEDFLNRSEAYRSLDVMGLQRVGSGGTLDYVCVICG